MDNSDGTITDNNTGLMWEKKDDNNVGGFVWEETIVLHPHWRWDTRGLQRACRLCRYRSTILT